VEPVFHPGYRCDSCFRRDYCRCFNWTDGTNIHSGFAEYLWLPFLSSDSVINLTGILSYNDMMMIEHLGLAVALVRKDKTGDVAVVIVQELIGLTTVAFLNKMDVARVIASDVSPSRLEAPKEIGAYVVVDVLNEKLVGVVRKETSGRGVDVVIQWEHCPNTLLEAFGSVRRGGSIWLAGAYSMPFERNPSIRIGTRFAVESDYHGFIELPLIFDPALFYMQSACGTGGARIPRRQEAVELIQSGKITNAKHINHVFPLEKTPEAFDTTLNSPECIRVLVEM
jgi:threonine dehydrogenase-like Zn-dependent dehydrogenase